jgi:hypothetical protein
MFSDFIQQLNKQTIMQFTLSFLGPSFLFWVANILISTQFNSSISLNSWHNLKPDGQFIFTAFFVTTVLATAWILYEIVPIVYRLLQGRLFWTIKTLRRWHISKFEYLHQQDITLANDIERLKNIQQQLLDTTLDASLQPMEFSACKKEINALSERLLERDFLKDTTLVVRIKNAVAQLENNRASWEGNPGFNEVEARLNKAYRTLIDACEYQIPEVQMERSRNFEKLTSYYPPHKAWIVTTAFGNCWAAIEAYPLTRYGISMPLLWPRLYNFMSEKVQSEIDQAKSQIDAYVGILTLTFIFSVFWFCCTLIFLRLHFPFLLILLILSALFLPRFFYSTAANATVSYGKLAKAAVDLYRRDVIKRMALAGPLTIEQEKETWAILSDFWIANLQADKLQFVEETSNIKVS